MFFLFSFCSILFEYYNKVVNHSNYKNRYAICFLISYSIKTDRTPIIHSFLSSSLIGILSTRVQFFLSHQFHQQYTVNPFTPLPRSSNCRVRNWGFYSKTGESEILYHRNLQ